MNLNEGSVQKVEILSFFDIASNKISNALRNVSFHRRMKPDLIKSHNQIVFYAYNSNKIEVIDLNRMCSYTMNLPFEIQSILLPSEKRWLIQATDKNKYILKKSADSSPCPNVLQQVEESSKNSSETDLFLGCTGSNLSSNVLSAVLKQKIDSPNRLLVSDNTYASIAVGFPDLDSFNELHSWPRPKQIRSSIPPVFMDNGQIIRFVTSREVPNDVSPNIETNLGIIGYLEIVDVVNQKLRYMPVPEYVIIIYYIYNI